MSLFISTICMIMVAFALGIVVGLLMKGIHVHHHTNSIPEAPKKYNKSSASNLPAEMQEYAQKNSGFINI